MNASITLTILFNEAFCVGVFERNTKDGYCAARAIFGKEPSGPEIMQFLSRAYDQLKFSVPNTVELMVPKEKNPKRMIREVRKLTENSPRISKAQDALSRELEKNKKQRKTLSRQRKLELEEQRFILKQKKKKEKKRGH